MKFGPEKVVVFNVCPGNLACLLSLVKGVLAFRPNRGAT